MAGIHRATQHRVGLAGVEAVQRVDLGSPGKGTEAPPPGPAWYGSWWFWTAVGVVAASAAGTTAGLLLSRQSGYRVEVIR